MGCTVTAGTGGWLVWRLPIYLLPCLSIRSSPRFCEEPFLWRYVRKRPWHFGGLTALIVSAAACAVAVQYGMKLLVDAMAMGREAGNVWFPFALFIFLIVVENLFWRSAGYLGCRTVVSSCADLRIDLFNHLTGHPMRYFS